MSRRALLGLALAIGAMVAFPAAAVIPYSMQRIGELRGIANLPGLPERLREPITRVERVAEDTWRVSGDRCHIDIRFVRVPSPRDGLAPPHYQPRMGERVCGR